LRPREGIIKVKSRRRRLKKLRKRRSETRKKEGGVGSFFIFGRRENAKGKGDFHTRYDGEKEKEKRGKAASSPSRIGEKEKKEGKR